MQKAFSMKVRTLNKHKKAFLAVFYRDRDFFNLDKD